MNPHLTGLAAALCAALMLASPLQAQSTARVMEVDLGSHVSTLPSDQWVEPACGTDGGPPSLRIGSFENFAQCPIEEATGLREIWFIYDDEWEYIARAYRDPVEIRSFSANVMFAQPIITSLMVDEDGLVQGYRIITDPEAPNDIRREAYVLYGIFKGLFNDAEWHCTELEPAERETPVEGRFIKEDCTSSSEQRFIDLRVRHLRKPGQNPREYQGQLSQTASFFESSVRLAVYRADAVEDAACCGGPAEG